MLGRLSLSILISLAATASLAQDAALPTLGLPPGVGAPVPEAALPAPAVAPDDQKLAVDGVGVLQKYCHKCHGVENKWPGLDMLDRETLLRPKDPNEAPYVVPGKLAESRIWEMLDGGLMPPERQPQPTPEEREILKRWILGGAPFPVATRQVREFIGEDAMLALIFQDLTRMRKEQRRFVRYFALFHLWNDPDLTDNDLRLVRAGVSKMINSLSQRADIVPPRPVDPEGLMLAVDLRDYGWTEKQWMRLLGRYPYALSRGTDQAQLVYDFTACELPYLRADWFIYAASRPPLYHDLLLLPTTVKELERNLAVDFRANFEKDDLARAAFRVSGVSAQNRMVERHSARNGMYWKSYDFGTNVGRGDLFRFPLGPEIEGVRNGAAFKHDGGELIFSLPNSLQGYLLVKADETRIDEGPIGIVNDPNQFSGSPAIVNGISCMGCHRDGMIRFQDELRQTFSNFGGQPVADKVLRIYPPQEAMSRLVEKDRRRFLEACDEATLGFLRTAPNDPRTCVDFCEPITHVSDLYGRRLVLRDVGRELGLPIQQAVALKLNVPSQDELGQFIRFSAEMQRMGLAPLAAGGPMPRDAWEDVFQRCSRALKLGIPQDFSTAQ